jgi:ketosteroid isomerase-like protein
MLNRLPIIFIICSTVLCVFGCKPKAVVAKNNFSAMKQIIKTDSMFSAMSKNAGMRKAFIEFIADEGVLLRPNHLPIVGADAIEFLSQASDSSSSVLSWEPLGGDVSTGGDLGFTYGIYELRVTDTSFTGTYVSIWKKQPDGKWKFVLDSGNDGTQAIE